MSTNSITVTGGSGINTITVTDSSNISVVTVGTQGLELVGSNGGIAIYDLTNTQWVDSASTRAESLTAKLYNLQFTSGGATVTGVLDEDNLASDSAVKLATQQSIKAYVDAQVTAQDLDLTDGSTTISIDLDSETLSILGGTGITSAASGNGVTISITTEDVQDLVGAMFTSNTESGIAVTYQDADGTIDLNVDDFDITLTGDVTGSGTVTNLGDVSFAATIAANSVALGTDTTGNYVATVAAGEGIDVSGSGSETAAVTISAEDATSSNKGIASFNSTDFTVSSGAVTVNAERVQDIVGAMTTSNTETGITVTYQDDDGTIDFVVGTLNQDTTGNAATATALETARTIGGTSFDGTADIAVALSATATALATARTIGGTSFDGTSDIAVALSTQATTITVSANNSTDETVYPVFVDGSTGAQGAETDTGLNYNPSSGMLTSAGFTGALTGNASTATTLETARTIGGVSFNGSAAIVPATITVADTTDTTSFVALFESATGDLAPKTDGALLYNAGTGTLTTTIITATTAFVPDASDGASLGTSALEFSDLYLADGAVVNFGDDQEVTLTHVADTGLLLNGTMQLQFNDASQYIQAPNATTLDINATDEVEINATLADINANLDVSGTYVGGGTMTTGGNVIIPDAGYIGSASDTDAIQIEADGDIVMSQDLAVTGTLGVTGVATLGSHLELGDSDEIKLGAGTDLQIYHDGTNSYVANKTGVLKLATETSGIAVQIGHGTSEVTFGDNVTVTGDLTINGATTTVDTTNLTVTDPLVKYAQAYTGTAYDSGIIITRGNGSATNQANRGFIWDASASEFATIASNTEDGTTAGNVTINDYVNLHVGALTSDDRSTLTGGLTIADGGQIGSASDTDAISIGSDGDVTLTQDLELQHDGAVISFGANDEVTLTHVHDTGLLLNGTMALQFNDASQSINAPSATVLDINATDEIELNAALLDVNANINASGTYVGAGLMTTGGNIVIPDAGYIGSASDTDAIQIEADGDVVLTQDLAVTGTLDVNSSADIAGDLTLSAGADGALRFSVASSVKIKDNEGASLVFEEADNAYMTFVTTNSSEAIKFDKALDINAAMQIDATITIGANDQGYDVIFYGDTASANMTWDTSADDLIFNGGAGLIVPEGQFSLGSTAVTSTAAELNALDGITAVVGELNALDLGATAIGTAVASKAVVLDANKDYTGVRNFTLSGELDAGSLDISGDADIDGTLEANAMTLNGTGITAVLTVTGTDDGAGEGPDVVIKRNSASPADNDTLGALVFKGENDADQAVTYGKIRTRILDVTDGEEDGQLEFMAETAGAITSLAKLDSTGLYLNTGLTLSFEGATANAHETTLTVTDPSADRTITLPNATGTVVLKDTTDTLTNKTLTAPTITGTAVMETLDISGNADIDGTLETDALSIDGTTITSTASEINLIDGDTSRGTTAVASGDGILINDAGTMRMTDVDTVSTYFSSHNVGGGNIVTTGALNSGSITSGFGAIDNGSSAITTTGVITGGSLLVADAGTIGSASDTDAVAISSAGQVSFSATNAIKVPVGTTAQRPSNAAGLIRYNSTLSQFEGYTSAWGGLGGGATGGGADQVFVENSDDVTTNYTITSGKNAMSVGPITVESGVVVTIPSGSRWVVL